MRSMLGQCKHGNWAWWFHGVAAKKARRISRKVEKRMWPKEERKANEG